MNHSIVSATLNTTVFHCTLHIYYFLKRSAQWDDLTCVKEHNPLKIQVPTKTCHQEFFYIRFIEYRARLEMIPYSSADQIYQFMA